MNTDTLPAVAEYFNPVVRANLSRRTILATGEDFRGWPLTLAHHSPGYAPAGSMARLDPGGYSVSVNDGRADYGQRYTTKEEAQAAFDRAANYRPY